MKGQLLSCPPHSSSPQGSSPFWSSLPEKVLDWSAFLMHTGEARLKKFQWALASSSATVEGLVK